MVEIPVRPSFKGRGLKRRALPRAPPAPTAQDFIDMRALGINISDRRSVSRYMQTKMMAVDVGRWKPVKVARVGPHPVPVPVRGGEMPLAMVHAAEARVGAMDRARVEALALARAVERKRNIYLREKRVEGQADAAAGDLMESSFVIELISFIPEGGEGCVQAFLEDTRGHREGVWYTYYDVPEMRFVRWFEGLATCHTEDAGEFRERGGPHPVLKKRWTRGKTPSLGAFFNQHIKGKYSFRRGQFES